MSRPEVRDGVLGRRAFIPHDPREGAHALAEVLGGTVPALAWLRTAVVVLEQPTGGDAT